MRFERVYPVEFFIRGKSASIKSLMEYLRIDKPDIIIKDVEEIEELNSEGSSLYKITGFSKNPL